MDGIHNHRGNTAGSVLEHKSSGNHMFKQFVLVSMIAFDILRGVAVIAGVLSTVFVVVGLLAALVNHFLPHPTPADKFVEHTLRPWIEQLPETPADWKPTNQ